MLFLPPQSLHIGSYYAVTRYGGNIHVLDAGTGALVPCFSSSGETLHEGGISSTFVDEARDRLVTVGEEDKRLKVWELSTGTLLSNREVPKKGRFLTVTRDGQTIIVGDKLGDLFSYPTTPPTVSSKSKTTYDTPEARRAALTSHENVDGELLLGHVSQITGLLLTCDENHIITSDRDDHIRVSKYPEGWNIERFCLGHTTYVSAIHIPSFDASTLISGGGDDSLYVWDYILGKLKFKLPILDVALPHVVVKGGRERWKARARIYKPRLNPSKRAKSEGHTQGQTAGKGKGKEVPREEMKGIDMEGVEANEDLLEADRDGDEDGKAMTETAPGLPTADHLPCEDVFVVSKIRSGILGDGREVVLFSVLGATSLFYVFGPLSSLSRVHPIPLNAPVTDFAFTPAQDTVFVLLDQTWGYSDAATKEQRDAARSSAAGKNIVLLRLSGDKFTENTEASEPWTPLLNGLNSIQTEATSQQVASLNLYGDLFSLPKDSSEEVAEEGSENGTPGPGIDIIGKRKTGAKGNARKKLRETLQKAYEKVSGEDRGEEGARKKTRVESAGTPDGIA